MARCSFQTLAGDQHSLRRHHRLHLLQTVGKKRTAGTDQIAYRVGQTDTWRDLDRAADRVDLRRDRISFKKSLQNSRIAGRDAFSCETIDRFVFEPPWN